MHYIDQYFRDLYTLIKSRRLKGKAFMFLFYNYLCAKNIIGKIFGIQFKTQKFKSFTIHFENYNAFFAIFTEMFIYNIYYFESSKNNPFIVDCGANIGLSVIYFKYLFPESTIECYEPDKGTFEILKKNIETNHLQGIKPMNCAVGGKEGKLTFYSQGNTVGGPGNSLEKSQATFDSTNAYEVDVITLSSQKYSEIDFLKIDIEGSEGKVFKDMKVDNLLERVGRMSLEYHYDQGIEDNALSEILSLIENHKMEYIINANTLVTTYVDEFEFQKWHNRYVLILDAYKR